MLGVESHHPPAGGAGGRLDTDAVLQRAGQQAIRIGLPQIVFAEEGEFVQVFQAMDVIGGDPFGLHLGPVIGDIVIDIAHLLNQQLTLVGPDLVMVSISGWYMGTEHQSSLSQCCFVVIITSFFYYDKYKSLSRKSQGENVIFSREKMQGVENALLVSETRLFHIGYNIYLTFCSARAILILNSR